MWRWIFTEFFGLIFRFLPWPAMTGLIPIGKPNANSPVVVTGNFRLTVERLKRALRGQDCFLLVANSKGINVWCAAAGGHFTVYDVLSVLKTTNVAELVNHRKLILPQLAAVGIETSILEQKSGWQVIWGPADMADLPVFFRNNFKKSSEMSKVRFSFLRRLEMALVWTIPLTPILVLPGWLLRGGPWYELLFMIWGAAILLFLLFPWFHRNRNPLNWGSQLGISFVVFGIVWAVMMIVPGSFENNQWTSAGFLMLCLLVLNIDLTGCTPTACSAFQQERHLRITLERVLCKNAGLCQQVCPRACFTRSKTDGVMRLNLPEACLRCGACVIQCPFDAVYFTSKTSIKIPPEVIRNYRLNLMGKRAIYKSRNQV